ncbi:MAG: Cof-type HAD-IIB family hydrolase [Dethiobacteria bacterium]|jgi:Cof subfamily protein (haloacid dehalogenase superfamily)
MKYKLLALDLDETLLNTEHKISPRNAAALRRAVERGMMVTIATGRMFSSTLPYARELQIDLPLITYHGALIKRAGGEVLRHSPLPFARALEILRLGAEEGLHLQMYLDDRLYTQEENEYTRYYQQIASVPLIKVGDLPDFLAEDKREPTKLTIINMEQRRLLEIQRLLQERYGTDLFVLQSRSHFLEITTAEATKGQALRFLGEKEGITPQEMVAIGDSYNDVDMLKFAGLGVAVANAPQDVQAAADVIARPNTEDGVAVFIEEYLLG